MVERSTIRILVLDDESFMLKLLNRVLANLGFTSVTLCDSGLAALESIGVEEPYVKINGLLKVKSPFPAKKKRPGIRLSTIAS